MCSFHRLARIEVTAGLQISQPPPVPCRAISSSNVLILLILTMLKSSCRVCEKCSHRCFTTLFPAAASSLFNRSVTSGTHPPHPVPAFVHDFSSPSVVRPLSRMAWQICPLLTLLHEQIWALSGRLPPAAVAVVIPGGIISSAGGTASGSLPRHSASRVP